MSSSSDRLASLYFISSSTHQLSVSFSFKLQNLLDLMLMPNLQIYLWPHVTLRFDLLTPKLDCFVPLPCGLRLQVETSLGRRPDCDWVRSSGRPRNRWIDQLRQDHQRPPADLWRAAIQRDYTGATLRSSTTTTTPCGSLALTGIKIGSHFSKNCVHKFRNR